MQDFAAAVAALRRGGIIAYPTEGVWGLGCDPDDERALSALIARGRVNLMMPQAPSIEMEISSMNLSLLSSFILMASAGQGKTFPLYFQCLEK